MENARKLDLRVVLGVVGVLAIAAAIWAATALAGGSSPSSANEPAGGTPAAEYVQEESETPQQRGDCPEGEGGGGSGSSDATAYDL